MTWIVGMECEAGVIIGGDSAGVSGWNLTVRADEKVWQRDGFAFGFTSSFRMGQLLRYSLRLPDSRHPVGDDDEAIYRWMVTDFVDAVRSCLKAGGYLTVSNGEESGGTFLVGWRGRLFMVGDDLQVARPAHGYEACGAGATLAIGAVHALSGQARVPAAASVVLAGLAAAAEWSAAVAGPFHLVTASKDGSDAQ